jgi:2-C-methyl-D-erythritol 4-phosphate cytidylyltransferase
MSLTFIGEVGVYLPARDAIKIVATDGDRIVDCYVRRSALNAIGCPQIAFHSELISHFQRNRDTIEIAAMVKYRRALKAPVELQIEAVDLAPVLPASAA